MSGRAFARPHARRTAVASSALTLLLALVALLVAAAPQARATSGISGNAALELGQPVNGGAEWTDTTRGVGANRGFDQVGGISQDSSGHVVATDTYANRTVGWTTFPASDGAAFDHVLGQPNLTEYHKNCSATAEAMPRAVSIAVSGGNVRIAIAGTDMNRVELRSVAVGSWPPANGAAATTVLGQPNKGTCTAPSTTTNANMLNPAGVWTDGTRIIVSDTGQHRILGWNAWPGTDGTSADWEFGQPDFTSNGLGTTATTMRFPKGVWANGTNKVLVADTSNNRVLDFNLGSWPAAGTTGATATWALGQANMTSGSVNQGGTCTASTLNLPVGLGSNGTKIAVTDSLNHRVLLWNAFPTANGPAAAVVLGQSTMTACQRNAGGTGATASTLATPTGAWTDGTQLLVTDLENNRILKWTAWPAANGTAAARVLGHTNFTDAGPNDASKSSVFQYNLDNFDQVRQLVVPFQIPNSSGKLLVTNGPYSWLHYYAVAPAANHAAPTWRFGQTSDVHGFGNGPNDTTTSQTLEAPAGVWSNGTKLAVSDSATNRVKLYDTFPTVENAAPTRVLGQASFTTFAGGTTASTMKSPSGVASDGTHLAVADTTNNRVLLWDTWPTTMGQPADHVLGQASLTTATAGLGASSLDTPRSVSMWGGKLAIADSGNDRILIWNTWPTSNGKAADVAVGATGLAVAGNIASARSVALGDNTIVWGKACGASFIDPIPTASTNAAGTSISATTACNSAPLRNNLSTVTGVGIDAGKVWVADTGHARVVRFDDTTVPVLTTGPTVTSGCAGTTVTWSTDESGTTELYWDTVSHGSGGAVASYASNSIDTTLSGLSHAATATGLTTGTTYYYKVRTVDGGGNVMATSTEYSFVAGAPAPTAMFADDTNAQPGTAGAVTITSATPHLSWINAAGCAVDTQRTQVWSDLLDATTTGLWHFDGSTADASATGATGTLPASPATPTYVAGPNSAFGKALRFDGVDDYAYVPPNATYDRAKTFTIEAWFRTTTTGYAALSSSYPGIIGKGTVCDQPTTSSCNFLIYLDRAAGRVALGGSVGGVPYWRNVAMPAADGHWHYAAMTVDSGGVVNDYVDGAFIGTFNTGGAGLDVTAGQRIIVGTHLTSGKFGGDVDDVRYSKVVRTAAEIHGTWEARQPHGRLLGDSSPSDAGVALASCADAARCADVTYGATGTKQPLTGGRSTVQAKVKAGAGAWGAWMTDWFEMTTGRPVNLYTDSVSASTGFANRTAVAATAPHFSWLNTANSAVDRQRSQVITTPLDDVQALWHFDGNGTDATGNGNTAAPSGATYAPSATNFGGASGALRNPAGAYATAPDTPALRATSDYTIETWFRGTSIANVAYPILVSKAANPGGCGGASSCQYSLEFERSTNRISFALASGGTEYDTFGTAAGLLDGNWHHVAGTMDSGYTMRLYVDGALVDTVAVGSPAATCACAIRFLNTTTNTNAFLGDIDDVRYSTVARTPGEILGYIRTRRPHATVMWDSDPGQAGIATFASCADLARCPDVTYGATGSAPLDLVHDGARYYARSKFRNAASVWGDWADWDWFESLTTLTFTLTSAPSVDLGATLPLNDSTGTSTMTVSTNNASGWSLSATNASDAVGMGGAGTIAPWSGTPATPTNWPAGTGGGFGLTLVSSTAGKDTTRWGTATAASQTSISNWAGPKLTVPTALADRQTYSSGTDTIAAGYRSDVPLNQAPGSYSTTVTYTMVANP